MHDPATPAPPAAPPAQPRNPLHGLTLEHIVTTLADHYGWDGLNERVPARCFASNPSVGSSLKFLRQTPWAREKVEGLYLYLQRELRRTGGR
ncbi:VF530 family protein [uncultured Sphaerotilus sp.]|uniref:VF530 family protein n=1 Tax=uncultured Sphaerotilus sp. TaxID=474984 RepID=UPI0030CA33D4